MVRVGTWGSDWNEANLPPGSYTFAVKDSNGCQATSQFVINPIPGMVFVVWKLLDGNLWLFSDISATYTAVQPRCHGDASGSITVSAADGAGGYSYSVFFTYFIV